VLTALPVQIGGASVRLSGTAFDWTPPTTGTSASGVVVGGSAYQNAGFKIAVRQAVPIALGLYPGRGAGSATMSDIKWTVSPNWSGGAVKTVTSATGTVLIEGSPPRGVVQVSVSLKVDLPPGTFYGFEAETIPIPGGVIAPVALTKPSHALSAILTVGLTTVGRRGW
jgi:hypothetical protein